MPKITALLHTHNDALRLGRALESLRPCDEVLVIDDCSEDETTRIAREHGARLKSAIAGVTPGAYAMDAANEWILCLLPTEALSEALEASLLEWKDQTPGENTACFNVAIREENEQGWHLREPEVRLINRKLVNWVGEMPPNQQCEMTLQGELLRFHQP
jgi:glycosyltransferase involved in cell wall biosynthesis